MNMWELPFHDDPDQDYALAETSLGEMYCTEHHLYFKHFCPDCVALDDKTEILFDCA